MPTQDFFARYPPFPEDLNVIELPRLSYAKLQQGDSGECQALWRAASDHGFFLLDFTEADGGMQLVNDMVKVFGILETFFNKPSEEKEKIGMRKDHTGYKPIGFIKHRDGNYDLTEMYSVSRDAILDADDPIDAAFAAERPFLQDMIKRLTGVDYCLLSHFARLLDLPPSAFESAHDPSQPTASSIRCIHYPPQEDATKDIPAEDGTKGDMGEEEDRGKAPRRQQRQYRTSLLGHTDNTTLTILFTCLGGLQVLPTGAEGMENDEGGESEKWAWVRPEPNCAVVNIGDVLTQWTGGLLRSSFHRVFHAPGPQAAFHRFSCGYFLKPADGASMARIQGGKVPPLSDEERAREPGVRYADWHDLKIKGIVKGENNAPGGVDKAPGVGPQSSTTAPLPAAIAT